MKRREEEEEQVLGFSQIGEKTEGQKREARDRKSFYPMPIPIPIPIPVLCKYIRFSFYGVLIWRLETGD